MSSTEGTSISSASSAPPALLGEAGGSAQKYTFAGPHGSSLVSSPTGSWIGTPGDVSRGLQTNPFTFPVPSLPSVHTHLVNPASPGLSSHRTEESSSSIPSSAGSSQRRPTRRLVEHRSTSYGGQSSGPSKHSPLVAGDSSSASNSSTDAFHAIRGQGASSLPGWDDVSPESRPRQRFHTLDNSAASDGSGNNLLDSAAVSSSGSAKFTPEALASTAASREIASESLGRARHSLNIEKVRVNRERDSLNSESTGTTGSSNPSRKSSSTSGLDFSPFSHRGSQRESFSAIAEERRSLPPQQHVGIATPSTILDATSTMTSPTDYNTGGPRDSPDESPPHAPDEPSLSSLSHSTRNLAKEYERSQSPGSASSASSTHANMWRHRGASTSELASRSASSANAQANAAHRARSQTDGGGNVHMWDSVWPENVTRSVHPFDIGAASPVAIPPLESPFSTAHVPTMGGAHGRSMSGSVGDSFFGSQGRRGSNVGLLAGRSSPRGIGIKLPAPTTNPDQTVPSPPSSPLLLKSPSSGGTRSFLMGDRYLHQSYRRSTGNTAGSSSDRSSNSRPTSPLVPENPYFHNAAAPGSASPRAISSLIYSPPLSQRDYNPALLSPRSLPEREDGMAQQPELMFTHPTPTDGVSPDEPHGGGERAGMSGDSRVSPQQWALPPALAQPDPPPSQSVAPPPPTGPNLPLPDAAASVPTATTTNTRSGAGLDDIPHPSKLPLRPGFRRAISSRGMVAAPRSPQLLPAADVKPRSTSSPSILPQRAGGDGGGGGVDSRSATSPTLSLSPLKLSPERKTGYLDNQDKASMVTSPPGQPESDFEQQHDANVEAPGATQSPPPSLASNVLTADTSAADDQHANLLTGPSGAQQLVFDDSNASQRQAASGVSEANEAMAQPSNLLPADVAFEEEGLLTLERIFLLSKSEHVFHR